MAKTKTRKLRLERIKKNGEAIEASTKKIKESCKRIKVNIEKIRSSGILDRFGWLK